MCVSDSATVSLSLSPLTRALSSDLPCPVDDNGLFEQPVHDFVGQHVKAADKGIIDMLKKRGRLAKNGTLLHPYPFCWRSDTPLIYRAVPSWFVKVEPVREQLLKNNAATHWVPKNVRHQCIVVALRLTRLSSGARRSISQLAGKCSRLGDQSQSLLGHTAATLGVRRFL